MIINNENVHFYQVIYKTLSLVQKHDNSFISLYKRATLLIIKNGTISTLFKT